MYWDVFVSHATEDKGLVAEPLAKALKDAGLSVWYDQFQLRLGDRLLRSINNGLSNSRFGVIILSQSFFKKHWPLLELDALAQREEGGQKVILPIWYDVTVEEVRSRSPLLADRIAVKWSEGLQSVVAAILDVVKPHEESDRKFEDRSISSILHIKKQTLYLWQELTNHISDQTTFSAMIRSNTLIEIDSALEFLKTYKGLNYETKELFYDFDSGDIIYEITVTDTTPALWELVRRAMDIDDSQATEGKPRSHEAV